MINDSPTGLVSPDGAPIAAPLEDQIAAMQIALREVADLREELLYLLRAITRRNGGELFVPFDDLRDCGYAQVPITIKADQERGGVVLRTDPPVEEVKQ